MLRHSFESDVARGLNLTPDGSSHPFFRFSYAIPSVWHTWQQNFHFIFVIITIINFIVFHRNVLTLLESASAETTFLSVCVCVRVRVVSLPVSVRICIQLCETALQCISPSFGGRRIQDRV